MPSRHKQKMSKKRRIVQDDDGDVFDEGGGGSGSECEYEEGCCASEKKTSSSVPVLKKSRVPLSKNIAWKLVFPNAQMFRNMIRIISGILVEGNFSLCKTGDFEGLYIEALHPSHVCLINATFEQQVQTSLEVSALNSERFKVKMDTFKRVMDEFENSNVLEMFREAGSTDIILSQGSEFDVENTRVYKLHTMETLDEKHSMRDIQSAIGVDIDVTELKSFCKTSKDLGATFLQITVKKGVDAFGKVHMFLSLDSDSSTASMTYTFHCVVVDDYVDGGPACPGITEEYCIRAITASQDPDGASVSRSVQLQKVFDHKFSCEYMNSIMRNMERQMIHISLSQNHPMIIKYSLGNDNSSLKVVIAPPVSAENDE